MKAIKVTYTTQESFSEQNQKNIKQVMNDLKNLNADGINYSASLSSDNKTFIHTAYFKSEEDQKILNELASFKEFQTQLKASGLESPPKQEIMTFIESSKNIFN